MKVWIPSMIVEFAYKLTPRDQRQILEIIKTNVKLFMEKWNEFASQKS